MIFHFYQWRQVSSVKNQSKPFKRLLVGHQCLDRVILGPKPFDFNDFCLKLIKYLIFPKSFFFEKSEIELPQKTQTLRL